MTTLVNDKEKIATVEGEVLDPAFLILNELSSQSIATPAITDYLAHQITRNPRDLRSHTQRIFHFITEQKSKDLYSALVDLFVVLGDKGIALRTRMLKSAYSLLSEPERDSLKQGLAKGLASVLNSPPASKSLLTQGVLTPSSSFITKVEVEKTSVSAIDEARSYLEFGQLDEAVITLQKAILLKPRHLALHNDLLEIFQKMGDKHAFSSFYEQLLEREISLPSLWGSVAQEFGYGQL
ncbi:MAG: hypothetical protein GQ475_05125 [Methylococcaceae bacterium]|nr:hypothetical protein [Methylococcaceae bacterium]